MSHVGVGPPDTGRRWTIGRVLVVLAVVVFVVFWTYALFFASKEAVNKIGDRAWARRAEAVCAEANEERGELTDLRVVDPDRPGMLGERADLVDRATDIVEQMLDDVIAETPADEKGRAIVPLWESEYRQYVANRRVFADELRAGRNEPFRETAIDGIPISERLETFAGDNEMESCAPPRDLSL